jgi:tellurite resistance protein TerC
MSFAWWAWAAFVACIVGALALDLFVLRRHQDGVSPGEAAAWSGFWIGAGLAFGGLLWLWGGAAVSTAYLAAYLKSFSIDHLFVFALMFAAFGVPAATQYHVLFWGAILAVGLRALMILAGAAFLDLVHWAVYPFGALLVVLGAKMAVKYAKKPAVDPERNLMVRRLRGLVPTADGYRGQAFVVHEAGRWLATPLLFVLISLESADLAFALDEVPALLSISREPFLLFAANTLALLGLRALYFVLGGMLDRFIYLRLGVGVLLVFAGAKLLLTDLYKVPTWFSLTIISATLTACIVASLRPAGTLKSLTRGGLR